MRELIAFAILLAWPALTNADPASCVGIDNDLDRLACYDRAVGKTPAIQSTDGSGKWRVRTETSALTDQTNVFLTLASEEEINCGWNRGDKIHLVVRCFENTTSLIFTTGCHMTSSRYDDYGDVIYRLDDTKAQTITLNESTNNRSLGAWSGGKSIPLIKQMLGKSRMIVRMTPYGENPFTATFDINGLDKSISPLREACHW